MGRVNRKRGQTETLSAEQLAALTMVFEGSSLRAAARAIGTTSAKIERWAKKPQWGRHLADLEAKAKAITEARAMRRLSKSVDRAAEVLVELLESPLESVRLAAAAKVMALRGIGEHTYVHGAEERELVSKEDVVKALREAGITPDDFDDPN
jgi:hypothetical protein